MSHEDFQALILTARLSLISTILLLVICTPLAWWLSSRKGLLQSIVSTLVTLPMVLPPTVIGFYLLIALGPKGPLVNFLGFDSLVFTFQGLVIGSVIYSLPFVLTPLQGAFETIDKSYHHIASSLGAKPLDYFTSIVLPLSKAAYLRAFILGFAHTLGEFGIVMMIGGNIPGETRVLSMSLYEHVQQTDYDQAHLLALVLIFFSFAVIFPLNFFKSVRAKNEN